MSMRRKSRILHNGRKDGYSSGWQQGWRLGACQRILQHIPLKKERIRDANILYVPQGFEAIDWGVAAALQRVVGNVRIVHSQSEMLRAAESFKPDAVLVMNGLHVFPPDHLEQVDAIRRMGIRTAIWFADDPYLSDETAQIAQHYDYVFTHERACVPLYASLGCKQVHHLPLAAHMELFRPMQVARGYWHDICFIGMGFRNRIRLFDEIAPYLQDKKVMIAGYNWKRLKRYPIMRRFIHHGWTQVPETVRYYNGAKIVINMHRTNEPGLDNRNSRNWPGESINPRTFEMAACGTLQLTDLRPELKEFYSIGSEIAVFANAQQLIRQIDYYLKHDQERLRMAARGYSRTLRDHSFSNRIEKLLDILDIR
jgi:spore maturation protein CgeB